MTFEAGKRQFLKPHFCSFKQSNDKIHKIHKNVK